MFTQSYPCARGIPLNLILTSVWSWPAAPRALPDVLVLLQRLLRLGGKKKQETPQPPPGVIRLQAVRACVAKRWVRVARNLRASAAELLSLLRGKLNLTLTHQVLM